MDALKLDLSKPHEKQQQILNEKTRFNVVSNGRRWGKTKMSENLSIIPAAHGMYVGYWCPTYKDLSEVWKEVKYRIHPIVKHKDEQLKQIITLNGGIIDFWSMDDPNSGRGRKYHIRS